MHTRTHAHTHAHAQPHKHTFWSRNKWTATCAGLVNCFSFFFCKDGSDRLMKRASYSCCIFLCVVLAAAYLKYRRYRLPCLPFVWPLFFIHLLSFIFTKHTHTHTHTPTHTHEYKHVETHCGTYTLWKDDTPQYPLVQLTVHDGCKQLAVVDATTCPFLSCSTIFIRTTYDLRLVNNRNPVLIQRNAVGKRSV